MTNRLLFLWLASYALLWTLLSAALDPTVPYDAVEAFNWAINKEWGSPKNPWLVGAVMHPLLWWPGISLSWYWYAIHFLAAAIGMLGAWMLARQLSGSVKLAWLALLTLNLSGIINFDIIPYNDNYLLVMLWPWMMLFFLRAMTCSAYWWLPFSLCAGLAMMAKYSTFSFLFFIFLATLILPQLRKCYRQMPFYLAVILWLAMVIPNVVWLWQHDFAAFKWVDSQVTKGANFGALTALFSVFYPVLILWGILHFSGARLTWPQNWPSRVLLVVYLLPLVIISIWFSFHSGGRLTEWLQPYVVLAPALLMSCIKQLPVKPLRNTFIALLIVGGLILLGYVTVMIGNVRNAGQKFIGIKALCIDLEQRWSQHFTTPLDYVGGENLAQWMTVYAPSHPQVITVWSNSLRPNVYNAHLNRQHVEQQGVLLFGPLGAHCNTVDFSALLASWPTLSIARLEEISFRADPSAQEKPLCVAFVAPHAK